MSSGLWSVLGAAAGCRRRLGRLRSAIMTLTGLDGIDETHLEAMLGARCRKKRYGIGYGLSSMAIWQVFVRRGIRESRQLCLKLCAAVSWRKWTRHSGHKPGLYVGSLSAAGLQHCATGQPFCSKCQEIWTAQIGQCPISLSRGNATLQSLLGLWKGLQICTWTWTANHWAEPLAASV